MKITKIGHCCLIIEEQGIKILTDPGAFSTTQNQITGVDVVLITHEHPDHLHIESLKTVLTNNPNAEVVTNTAVGKILDKDQIKYNILEDSGSINIKGIEIKGFGKEHADIYKTIIPVQNTGYFIADKLFYPGDAFYNPGIPVDILALPVAGPWMKISDALDYAKTIKPRICFPVHDGHIKEIGFGPIHNLPKNILKDLKIEFIVIKEGETEEF
ncbi:MAG: MBL fold metallo-hydrolase [bacterium]|nr:MBL fold metallo-hydrolase [bacterium]